MNLIVGFNLGWSSSDPGVRNIGRAIPWRGYKRWMLDNLVPLYERHGVTEFEFHNPAGIEPTEKAMSFNQFPELDRGWWRIMRRKLGLSKLSSGAFVEAIEAVRDRVPGFRGIAYLGALDLDPDLADQENNAAWLHEFAGSVSAPLRSRLQIGLDASQGIAAGSREHGAVQLLDTLGASPVIEAAPPIEATHLHGYDVLMRYDRSYQWFLKSSSSPAHRLTGRKLVVLGQQRSMDTAKAATADIIERGHTPITWAEVAGWAVRQFGDVE